MKNPTLETIGRIYFLDFGEFWKIGFSTVFWEHRIFFFCQRHDNQDSFFVYLVEGTMGEEKYLHTTVFPEFRIVNEYYLKNERILRFIKLFHTSGRHVEKYKITRYEHSFESEKMEENFELVPTGL